MYVQEGCPEEKAEARLSPGGGPHVRSQYRLTVQHPTQILQEGQVSTDSLYSTLPRSNRRGRSVQTHCTAPYPGPTGGAGQYRLTAQHLTQVLQEGQVSTDSMYSTLHRSYRRGRSVQTHCTEPYPVPTGRAGQYRLTVQHSTQVLQGGQVSTELL